MENKELYLYKIWNENDSAVVCAESKEEASIILFVRKYSS